MLISFLESFLDNLGLNDEDSVISKDKSVWAYNNDLKNGDRLSDNLNESILDSSVKLLVSYCASVSCKCK